MLDRLPDDNYTKRPGSNVYNFIKLAADQFEIGENAIQTMKNWLDIDQAEGTTLDRIGKDVGQSRDGLNDIEYRSKIKIRINSNLSSGDIPTLNALFKAIYGGKFVGIQEGWNHVIAEPASLVVNVTSDAGVIESDIINSVTAGGVNIHLATEADGGTIKLVGKSYGFDVPLPITEMFTTEEITGVAIGDNIGIKAIGYGFDVPFPICGEFYAEP